MASYPTEEKCGRSWPDPQRSLIIQNALVPASEVGRAPAVRILVPEASLAFERDQKLSLSADRYALGGGSPSTSSPTDLSYSQVNTTMLELYSHTNTHNSPTRKGGLESPCTRNGCADSIPIVSRTDVECSAPADNYVEHSTLFTGNTNNPYAVSDSSSNTNSPYAASDLSANTNSPYAGSDVFTDTNSPHVASELSQP